MIQDARHLWNRFRSTNGQIIIFVAVLLVAMLGMVGLSIDLGYSFAERRTVQNAADAGAIAGARAVTQWSTSNPDVTALAAVQSIVSANNMGNAKQKTTCYYVDDTNTDLTTCGDKVPASATGVRLLVSETHSTFFIRIIPGAPKTATTSASAIAHAQIVTPDGSGGPFIVCGGNANLVSGGSLPILLLQSGGTYAINPAAVGKTFEIHGKIDDCGAGSNRFKGLALGDVNAGKKLGDWFYGDDGEKTGPANEVVSGVQGCSQTQVDPFDCVLYLPLATSNPPPKKIGNDNLFNIVAYGAFEVSSCGGTCKHQATLIGKYIIDTPSDLPSWTPGSWARGQNGIIAIRLTK